MNIDEKKITTYHAICAVVVREYRVQRNIHLAQVADYMAKSPSAWQDIESGKKKIDFDSLLRVCRGLRVPPASIMQIADAYEHFLRFCDWSVVVSDVGGSDVLITRASEYWKSAGCRAAQGFRSFSQPILDRPQYSNDGWRCVAPVFWFAVDERFRSLQLDEEQHRPFVGPMRPFGKI